MTATGGQRTTENIALGPTISSIAYLAFNASDKDLTIKLKHPIKENSLLVTIVGSNRMSSFISFKSQSLGFDLLFYGEWNSILST